MVLKSVRRWLNGEIPMRLGECLQHLSFSLRNSTHRPRSRRLSLDQLEDRRVPSLVGSPSAITFGDPGNPQVRVYAVGDDGSLKENAFDGTSWHWSDLGAPSGALLAGTPSPVFSPAGIDVYARGTDGNLKIDSFRNGSWSWYELGSPGGVALAGSPSAVYDPATGDKLVYIRGIDGSLKENHRVAALGFFWGDLGKPSGVALDGDPSPILFNSLTISVYARGTDGSLKEADWLGVSWVWTNLGKPGGVALDGSPSAVYDPANLVVRVYLRGTDGALKEEQYLPGIGSSWSNLGTPSGVPLDGSPSAVVSSSSTISVFVRGTDGSLKEVDLNSGSWAWTDQSTGDGVPLSGSPSAVYDTAGNLRVYLVGMDGSLKEDDDDITFGWSWGDLGDPSTGGDGNGPWLADGGSRQTPPASWALDPNDQVLLQPEARLSDLRFNSGFSRHFGHA